MATGFNFDDVVLAKGDIQDRSDRQWALVIGCGAQSSFSHGTSTQQSIARLEPLDVQSGIRTSDDLLALQGVIDELAILIAEQLEKFPLTSEDTPSSSSL